MAFELNQNAVACKALGRKWHKAKIELIMNGRKLYMVSLISHTGKGWHDKILHPNCIRVVQIFCYRDKVHTQSRRTDTWHQAVIVHWHNHGASYTVLWSHCNTWNEIVSINCIIGINPFKGHLRRYLNGFAWVTTQILVLIFPSDTTYNKKEYIKKYYFC